MNKLKYIVATIIGFAVGWELTELVKYLFRK